MDTKEETLVISRAKWLRGEKAGKKSKPEHVNSCLYDPTTETSCCIGIYLSGLGVKPNTLCKQPTAVYILEAIPEKAKWLIKRKGEETRDSSLAKRLASANDKNVKYLKEWDKINDLALSLAVSMEEFESRKKILREKFEKAREDRITKLFAQENIKVEFID